jgi:hypothetical protein
LAVPFPLGFPLGRANDVALQRAILCEMLALSARNDVPVLVSSGLPPAA